MSQILSRQGTFSGLSFGVGIEVNSYTMIQFGVWDWGHSAKNRANNKWWNTQNMFSGHSGPIKLQFVRNIIKWNDANKAWYEIFPHNFNLGE